MPNAFEPRESNIYIIECQGHFKIGVADHPKSRLDSLQIGNPFPLTLVAHAQFKDSFGTEDFLHRKYAPYRVRGEWFKLPQHELNGLLELFQQPDKPTPQRPPQASIPNTWYCPDTDYIEASDNPN